MAAALAGVVSIKLYFGRQTHYHEPHRIYTMEGFIELRPPGPSGARLPAAVCMSANGFRMIVGKPLGTLAYDRGKSFIVCRIPPRGLKIPFKVEQYTTEGYSRTILLAAFLASTEDKPTRCESSDATLIEASTAEIGKACFVEQPPPKSELALLAPYHDSEGRPADTIKITPTRAR